MKVRSIGGVVPDLEFPSVYDTEEIGESSLDHALNWDHINPIRHVNYGDLSALLPTLQEQFEERSAINPDFISLEDQVELAQETRKITDLPLNEEARIALRDSQEKKALDIENKRRKALGEELLTSLDLDDDENAETDQHDDVAASDDDGEDEDEDVLLVEAGNVLVDVLMLKKQSYAIRNAD